VDVIAAIESKAGISAITGAVAGAILTANGTAVVEVIKRRREEHKKEREGLEIYVTAMGDHLRGPASQMLGLSKSSNNDYRSVTVCEPSWTAVTLIVSRLCKKTRQNRL
jgi:hypothetical protein